MSDEYLDWLEEERSKKTFNLGGYNATVTKDQVVIRAKTAEDWWKDAVFGRSKVNAFFAAESRTAVFLLCLLYAVYSFGFLMLPTKAFLIGTGVFFVGVFSLSKLQYLDIAFKAAEDAVGEAMLRLSACLRLSFQSC